MVPDKQKVRTNGQRQNYIPQTSSGDKKVLSQALSHASMPYIKTCLYRTVKNAGILYIVVPIYKLFVR